MINKLKIYNNIKDDVIDCKLCKLYKERSNAVPGQGNIDAKIVFVGEAPGRNEDKAGLPFVGQAGKILEESLKKAGFQRKDVYITNVVKCRPPNNRVPEPDELLKCIGYLKKEIQMISPNIVCILGATALQSLLNLKGLQRYHGKTIICDGIRYFITFHPAATIYNSQLRDIFFSEINMVMEMIKNDDF